MCDTKCACVFVSVCLTSCVAQRRRWSKVEAQCLGLGLWGDHWDDVWLLRCTIQVQHWKNTILFKKYRNTLLPQCNFNLITPLGNKPVLLGCYNACKSVSPPVLLMEQKTVGKERQLTRQLFRNGFAGDGHRLIPSLHPFRSILHCRCLIISGSLRWYLQPTEVARVAQLLMDDLQKGLLCLQDSI